MDDCCFNPQPRRRAFVATPAVKAEGLFVETGSDFKFQDYLLKEIPSCCIFEGMGKKKKKSQYIKVPGELRRLYPEISCK